MKRFYGLGSGELPAAMDLRAQGWRLLATLPLNADDIASFRADRPILLDHAAIDPAIWRMLNGPRGAALRRWTVVLGVEDSAERARLLHKGFGDCVSPDVGLVELAERTARVRQNAQALQRFRRFGGLRLDLLEREAYMRGKAIGLHPREFAVLWRLMETPGVPVEKLDLLRDVWRVAFVPETNSVAVHASRLRAKLAAAGLAGLIQSTPGGGYQLVRHVAVGAASAEGEA